MWSLMMEEFSPSRLIRLFSFSAGISPMTSILALEAFGAADNIVAVTHSQFANNLACLDGPPCSGDTGSAPNELLALNWSPGFVKVIIAGDLQGSSFTGDDFNIAAATPCPENPTLTLIISSLIVLLTTRSVRENWGYFDANG